MHLNNIVFDFDGVLVDSVSVKTDAFQEMYVSYGIDVADAVVEHHLANGGMSRFDKFRIYHREFLDVELSNAEVDAMATRFGQLVVDKVVAAPEVPGARELLEKTHACLSLFVITGTPTNEILEILARKQWENYFNRVFGSPESKLHWLRQLHMKGEIKPEETIFVGDALSDHEAAKANAIRFCLREHEDNAKLFSEYQGDRVRDMYEFQELLQEKFQS